MGMVLCLRLASSDDISRLTAAPDQIYDFIVSEEGYHSGGSLEFDKEWHAVHFLLTKSAGSTDNPLSILLGSGTELGPDHGYGPAWLTSADKLAEFSDAISKVSNETLIAEYDSVQLVQEEVYLGETLNEEGPEALEFLIEHVDKLRKYAAYGKSINSALFSVIT